MGHTTITTTLNIYAHVYEGDTRMEALVERLYVSGAVAGSVAELPRAEEG